MIEPQRPSVIEAHAEAHPPCPRHADRAARFECPRCGDYRCDQCVVDAPWGESACVACDAAGRLRYPLAWEHGLDVVSTVRAALLDSNAVFGAMPERASIARALVFAVAVPWLAWVAPMVIVWAGATDPARDPEATVDAAVIALGWVPTASLASVALGAGALMFGTRAWGDGCSARLALRASGYAQAMWVLPMFVLPLVCCHSFAALAGVVVVLAAFVVIRGQAIATFARRHGGVRASRTRLVAALELLASSAPWGSFLLPLLW